MTQRGSTRGFCHATAEYPHHPTFINFANNGFSMHRFAAFGEVVEGMEVVDEINAQYGARPEPDSTRGMRTCKSFPELDYYSSAIDGLDQRARVL